MQQGVRRSLRPHGRTAARPHECRTAIIRRMNQLAIPATDLAPALAGGRAVAGLGMDS